MQIIKSYFNNKVHIIKNEVHKDRRGHFSETYNQKKFKKMGIQNEFKQDNFSFSKYKNTFRGIHLQKKPYGQAKLVRVVSGKIIDLIFDLRIKSKTFGKFEKILLSESKSEMVYIPEEFGHGFLTLSENTVVHYKVTNFYSPSHEITINYKDNNINLNMKEFKYKVVLSKKDLQGMSLNEYKRKIFYK